MEIYCHLNELLNAGKKAVLVTITCSSQEELVGGKVLIDEVEVIKKGEMPLEVYKTARELAQEALPKSKTFTSVEKFQNNLEVEFFVETIVPVPKVIIFGGGHVSLAVAERLHEVGFSIQVIDDRPEFANHERFPFAAKALCCSFQDAVKSLEMEIDPNTYIIIMTRGHLHDYECLAGVLGSKAKYIGMIGSKRKVKLLKERLAKEGFPEEKISSIFAPVGLNIGAETPEEIAISIVAELIAVRRGKVEVAEVVLK